jgi:iron complex outermembrane recepter protein
MNTTIRRAIALAMGACAITAAHAQDQQTVPIEEVRVTGSRIVQSAGMTTPTPVASLSVSELSDMAPASIVEGLTQLPQFYGSATVSNFNAAGNGFFTSPGGGSLNLRGIGTKRTLVLLDGRRVVSSTIYGGPDVNLFPEAMLKSVESVTGGASAAYGTDAVSGVVNFILDTHFTGLKGHAQVGQTTHADAENNELSLSYGRALGERMHLLLSGEHANQQPVQTWNGRDWYDGWGLVQSTAAGNGTSRDNPRFIPAPQVTSINASYDGVITAWQATPGNTVPASFVRSQFNRDGSISPFIISSLSSTVNGAQSTANGGSGTNNDTDRPNVGPRNSHDNFFGYLDFAFNDNAKLFFQGIYSEQTLKSTNTGGVMQAGAGQPITIFAGNPFLPASLRQQMAANNIASFTMGRIGSTEDIGANSYAQQDTSVRSATLGFKGTKSGGHFEGWTLDAYYQYGDTDVTAAQKGGIRIDRLSLALDAVTDPATGRVVCNVTLVSGLYPDCVPLNLFGRGHASQAAIDWVTGFDPGVNVTTTPYLPGRAPETYSYVGGEDKLRLIDLKQHVAEFVLSGEVAKGWAGPISVALGGHYRKETVRQDVQASQGNPAADPFVFPVPANNAALGIRGAPPGAVNNSVEIQFSKVPFIRGGFDVKEAFTEALVPLLADVGFMKQLNFNGAARWADYGGSGSIWSYKGGLDASITSSLRLRGTYSRDVRAANLGERFDRTGGAANITDSGLAGNPAYPITIVQGGNPAVEPELADTLTFGVVYRPEWLSGFDVSVDWLDVDLQGAIESFTAQQIVDACYKAGNQDQCAFIDRSAAGNRIFIVNQTVQNVSKAKIAGVDLEMGYVTDLNVFGGGERLSTRLFASWLEENSTTSSTGVKSDRTGDVGLFALPKWKVTGNLAYTRGPFRSFVQARFIDGGKMSSLYNINNIWDVTNNTVSSVTYVDTRLSYRLDFSSGSAEIFGSVTNLFNRDPPLIPAYSAFTAAPAQTNAALYDLLGRRFTVGFKVDF